MDWSGLPSLNSLRAFAVVADTGGYSRAAQELNVTQAAVSQQVRTLEAYLGVSLIERVGRGIALTPFGDALGKELASGFTLIKKGVDQITGVSDLRPVQVTMSPAFAVEWIMPRLPEFQKMHPEINLVLNPTSEIVDLKPGGTDLAIRYKNSTIVDDDALAVLISDMVVVAAPSLVGGQTSGKPPELSKLPWLQELGTTEAIDWFTRNGVPLNNALMTTEVPGNLAVQAVRRGDGVTYTARAFVQDDIDARRLVVLSSEPAAGLYILETAPGFSRPAVKAVEKWLRRSAETVVAKTVTG